VLEPHDIGIFASAMAVLAFVNMFTDQGLGDAIVQRREITPQLLNAATLVNFSLACIVFVVLWWSAPLLSKQMNVEGLTEILKASGVIVVIMALSFSQMAMHRRNFNFRWLALCSFVSTTISGGIGIYFALTGWGIWSLVIQVVCAALLSTLMLWSKSQWNFTRQVDFHGLKSLLSYGVQRLAASLLDFANTRFIELFIATTLGPIALGVYYVGAKIYQVLMEVMGSIVFSIALSGFSRVAHDRERLHNAYYQSMTSTAAIAVPVFCFISALAPEVTLLIFGEKWVASTEIMTILTLLGAIQALAFQNGIMFNAIGKPYVPLGFLVFRTIVTMSALWLSRNYDLVTIVEYIVVSQFLIVIPNFLLARYVLKISLKTLVVRIWPFIFGSFGAMVVIALTRNLGNLAQYSLYVQASCLVLVGVMTYMIIVALTGWPRVIEIYALIRNRNHYI
jgi:O-antigen/teichoic acid export membrane protein